MLVLLSLVGYTTTLLVSLFIVFIFFCAVLHLRTVRDNGYLASAPKIVLGSAYGTLFLGMIADFLLSLVLSILWLDLPQEWLTTDKVKRLKVNGNRWQKSGALWLCRVLNALDKNHCGI